MSLSGIFGGAKGLHGLYGPQGASARLLMVSGAFQGDLVEFKEVPGEFQGTSEVLRGGSEAPWGFLKGLFQEISGKFYVVPGVSRGSREAQGHFSESQEVSWEFQGISGTFQGAPGDTCWRC